MKNKFLCLSLFFLLIFAISCSLTASASHFHTSVCHEGEQHTHTDDCGTKVTRYGCNMCNYTGEGTTGHTPSWTQTWGQNGGECPKCGSSEPGIALLFIPAGVEMAELCMPVPTVRTEKTCVQHTIMMIANGATTFNTEQNVLFVMEPEKNLRLTA